MNSATLLSLFAVWRVALAQSGASSGSGSLQPDYVPVCEPQNYTRSPTRPFPTLPDQFSTIIEANALHQNWSVVIAEYYDDPGNRGRLDYVASGETETAIFDYDLGEAFLIPDRARGVACGVQLLNEPSGLANNNFGITYVNGSVHIGTVKQLFDIADNVSARYIGSEEVRGIPCDRWQNCHVLDNESYTLDYYFAYSGDWKYAFPGDTIPVQMELTGSKAENGTLIYLSHIYSFIGFHSGPDAVPDSVFEVPTGLPCLGRIAGKDLPPVPQFFSMQIETLDTLQKIGTVREFYDTGLFRLDLQYNSMPYSIIHDFELSVEYIIDRRNSNCSVMPLENETNFYDVVRESDGSTHLRSPTDFFRLGTGYNFSYEGETTVRGIEADAWISVRPSFPLNTDAYLLNGTVELFYSRPGWTSASIFSTNYDPIPLAINLTGILVNSTCNDGSICGTKISSFYNIFDFSSQEPDFDIFDTSFCAEPGEYRILSMIIPGQESGSDISQLRRNIRLNITEWADIPKLQVANIEVLGENGSDIFVTLQILPLPSIARYSGRRTPQNIYQEILNLTSPNGQLPFSITLPSGNTVRPFLLRVDPNCPVLSTTITVTGTTTPAIGSSSSSINLVTRTTAKPATGAISSPTASVITVTGTTTPAIGSSSSSINLVTRTTAKPATGAISSPTASVTGTATNPTNPTMTTVSNLTATPTGTTSTNTATTPGTQASECPTTSSSSSSGVSNGTAAGIALAMFVVGMIFALLGVLLIKFCQSRRKSFNLVKGEYMRQENEMEGFAD